ncbi:dephospho-CoA kinase [Sulfurisoma sediminicola]|uniref:Dephospho-CoA kinase n=1 Tax=Sulfurisoma sediminicola TaxID=1381557 RepID=A0A497XJ01_9PROT|nr:dephospho-CoA kinase [Sulfurisoma sediminicola]RLJ67902.1 dephospho-CoA kinase [Sulfurisoma sediminicola]
MPLSAAAPLQPLPPFVVGLTGGIGSGKSAAAEAFAALGAAIVDTDAIAHELTGSRGSAMPAIREAFGKAVLTADGALDRAAMRALAFTVPAARERLEAILHPLIRGESERLIADHANAPYIVLVVPLLVESGAYRDRIDRVAVVDCDDEVRIQRVIARSGLTRAEIKRILAAQAGRDRRLAAADDVIENVGTQTDLREQVALLDGQYRALAAVKAAAANG